MRLFLLALFGVSLAIAQSTNAPANARIEGQVVSVTGEPVKNATLRLVGLPGQPTRPGVNYSQSSKNDGAFVFEAVPPGTYIVAVQKDGFTLGTSRNQITLTPGQARKDLIVKLNPLGVISGRRRGVPCRWEG